MVARRWCLALVLLAAVAACDAGTGGRRVQLDVGVRSTVDEGSRTLRFVNDEGWAVELEQACVAVGPFTFWENAGALWSRSLPRRLYDALVPSAHAHPGADHFNGGQVQSEWTYQIALDLVRQRSLDLGTVEGLAGRSRSISIDLQPPRPSILGDATCLRGHHAYVVGTATRASVTVAFEGGLDLPASVTDRVVSGVPVEADLDDGVRLTVVLDPRAWLAAADFGSLATAAPSGRMLITADSQPRAAWFLGLRGASAFRVEVAPPTR